MDIFEKQPELNKIKEPVYFFTLGEQDLPDQIEELVDELFNYSGHVMDMNVFVTNKDYDRIERYYSRLFTSTVNDKHHIQERDGIKYAKYECPYGTINFITIE